MPKTVKPKPFVQITWQEGPIPKGAAPTGAQVEDVLEAAITRLEGLHADLPCAENLRARDHIEAALDALVLRTARRRQQGVEGTGRPHTS